jgi:hypothetical protein
VAERTKRTPKKRDWQTGFLAALSDGLTVTAACKQADVARSNAYDERDRNETFAQAWDDIIERTTETMEAEAYRRAVEGWRERGIFNEDGEEVGEVRKYSDTLLIFLLKARRPATYRERHEVKHTGNVDHRLKLDLRKLTDEQLKALEAIQPDDPAGAE